MQGFFRAELEKLLNERKVVTKFIDLPPQAFSGDVDRDTALTADLKKELDSLVRSTGNRYLLTLNVIARNFIGRGLDSAHYMLSVIDTENKKIVYRAEIRYNTGDTLFVSKEHRVRAFVGGVVKKLEEDGVI